VPVQNREKLPASARNVVGNLSLDQQPGTAGNTKQLAIAPLPPPVVIASAALQPDACKAEIKCCHATSDWLMVRVYSAVVKVASNGV